MMQFQNPQKRRKTVSIMLLALQKRTEQHAMINNSSRLSCQIKVDEDMDGMEVPISGFYSVPR